MEVLGDVPEGHFTPKILYTLDRNPLFCRKIHQRSANVGLLHFRRKNLLLSHIGRSAPMENSVDGGNFRIHCFLIAWAENLLFSH